RRERRPGQIRGLSVVGEHAGVLEEDGRLQEGPFVARGLSELELRACARVRPECLAQERHVRALVLGHDLREPADVTGEGAPLDGLAVERRLEILEQEGEVEYRAVLRR